MHCYCYFLDVLLTWTHIINGTEMLLKPRLHGSKTIHTFIYLKGSYPTFSHTAQSGL